MWIDLFLVGLLGGLIGLDRRAVFQVMLSNPLVAAALIGWWSGDVAMGIRVGAITSLLWVHELPVGASIPPNDTVIAVSATVLGSWLAAQSGAPVTTLVVLALLWAIPFGVLAQRLDASARRLNIALSRWVVQGPPQAQGRMLVQAQGVGLLTAFAGDMVCTWFAAGSGLLVLPRLVAWLSMPVTKGLNLVYYLLPLVGVAAGIATINRRRAWWTVVAIFVVFNLLSAFLER